MYSMSVSRAFQIDETDGIVLFEHLRSYEQKMIKPVSIMLGF